MGCDITHSRLHYRPYITDYRKLSDDTFTYNPGWPTIASNDILPKYTTLHNLGYSKVALQILM